MSAQSALLGGDGPTSDMETRLSSIDTRGEIVLPFLMRVSHDIFNNGYHSLLSTMLRYSASVGHLAKYVVCRSMLCPSSMLETSSIFESAYFHRWHFDVFTSYDRNTLRT